MRENRLRAIGPITLEAPASSCSSDSHLGTLFTQVANPAEEHFKTLIDNMKFLPEDALV